jgi:hypothetical protein
MVQDEMQTDQETSGLPIAAIVGTAVAAGVIAFVVRRSKRARHEDMANPASIAAAALEQVGDPKFRARTAAAMLAYVDQGFKRAEKSIKDL